jgi:hypothetical protein|tara:strand:- start:377 stop:502 length:126 start_codon:yes stop_codon:yes gene_type:complete
MLGEVSVLTALAAIYKMPFVTKDSGKTSFTDKMLNNNNNFF